MPIYSTPKRYWLISLFKLKSNIHGFQSTARKHYFRFFGLKIGENTLLPRCHFTWPHNVRIGNNCTLEHSIYFKYDGPYFAERTILIGDNVFIGANVEFNIRKGLTVGDDCLIASGCRFIDHDHGFNLSAELFRVQAGTEQEIILGSNVWLGTNVVILKGVQIGHGAIIGAGAVVTHNVPPFEIWAGVPAKKIAARPKP